MNSSIKFTRLDGLENIDIETISLTRNPTFKSTFLSKSPLLCILLTAIILLSVTLFTITLVVILTHNHGITPDNYTCNTTEAPPLVVVSLDGFRPDYLDSGLVPTLYKLAEEGVRADYLMSQFPTKTFPNHFTIATGLHPAWHGIVDNSFYDKTLNKFFSLASKDINNPEWWLGTPIWKRARDEGLKTASYYWPGSEVPSMLPDYYFPYKTGTELSSQLQQVDSWLQLPVLQRPRLIMLYSYQPDHASHSSGYYSVAMNESMRGIDAAFQEFLSNSSVWNCVDKIFVSDHGFANVSLSKTLYLEDILNLSLIYPVQSGPVVTFNVRNQSEIDSVLNSIRTFPKHGITFDAYKGTGLPPRMHYGFGPRYCDIVVLNRVGWVMLYTRENNYMLAGTHGWDNHARDMRGLFIAQGPSFKRNYKLRGFENTQVYDLLSTLLRIEPGANNGSMGALNDVISENFKGNLSAPKAPPYSTDSEVQCSFPSLEVLIERAFCNECLCESCNKTQLAIEYLLKLNLTGEEIGRVKGELIPGGLPKGGGGSGYCYLANEDSLVKYSSKLRAPVWTGFMISGATPSGGIGSCPLLNDPRISKVDSPLCSDYKDTAYSMASILPGESLTSATLALKSLPKFLLNQTISRLLTLAGTTTYVVVVGPVFLSPTSGERVSADEWTDWIGNRTIAIPSHVYQIVIPCSKRGNKCELIRRGISGYIVENTDTVINSASIERAYQLRMSTIREIERVSGVDFFPDLSVEQQLEIELKITTGFDD